MSIYAATALVNVATSVILGFLVLDADRRSATNRLFAFFAATVAFWSYAYFEWQIATEPDSALFWSHALMAGAIFITPVYFHFITRFLHPGARDHLLVAVGYAFIAVFSVLNWTPQYISHVEPLLGFPFWPVAGPYFLPFLIVWGLYAVYPIILLFRELRGRTGKREQAIIGLLIVGTVIGYAGGATNYFLWYGIPVLPFGNISASIYLAIVAFATVQHRLFNLRVITAELLTFAIWLFAFTRFILAETVRDQLIEGSLLAVSLVIGILLVRSVNREVAQREEIQALSDEKSEFMTFASHEIRNPITAMRGYASLIVDGTAGEASQQVRDAARHILVEGNDVLHLIAQYLSKSKVELGKIQYLSAPFDLGAMVSGIVDSYAPHAAQTGVAIVKHIDTTQRLTVVADESKVKEVINNLIDNSFKYTRQGTITVSVIRHGVSVRVEVSDTGVGIAPEVMPQLFKKFSRADAQRANLLGTGVGLYLAKTFIDAMGGRIWAESEGPRTGSRFIVEFRASA